MLLADVLDRLVTASTVDEATAHDMRATIRDHFADDLDGLSDEEKASRPARVDKLAGTVPAMATGGISKAELNAAIAQAIKDYEASKANSAAKRAEAPMSSEPAQPASFEHVAPPVPAQPAQPADTVAPGASSGQANATAQPVAPAQSPATPQR